VAKGIRHCENYRRNRRHVRKLRRMLESLDGPQLPAVGPAADLSEEDRSTLSSYGEFHFASHGDLLIAQGQSHGKLFFIISGVASRGSPRRRSGSAARRDPER